MLNVEFPGSVEIKKPANMTDEQCSSAWAMPLDAPIDLVVGPNGETEKVLSRRWLMHYMPNKEDLAAMNEGRGFWLTITANQLTPHFLFTMNEKDEANI